MDVTNVYLIVTEKQSGPDSFHILSHLSSAITLRNRAKAQEEKIKKGAQLVARRFTQSNISE
jgi:hypothetical protein